MLRYIVWVLQYTVWVCKQSVSKSSVTWERQTGKGTYCKELAAQSCFSDAGLQGCTQEAQSVTHRISAFHNKKC